MTLSDHANGCKSARANGPTVSAPTTPRGHASKEVNEIIESISREFDLPIRPRQTATSPRKRDDTLSERCVDSIVYLYFRNRLELTKVIDTFRDDYRSGHTPHNLLKDFAERIRDASYIEKHKPTEKLFTKPALPSVPKLKKPSLLKQTQLVPQIRKSSRLSQDEDQKKSAVNSPQPAQDGSTLPSPSRSLKRPPDQDTLFSSKYVSPKKKKKHLQSSISDYISYKASTTNTSFLSDTNQASAPSIFSATNNDASFVSTVPTESDTDDESFDLEFSSSYGELDPSQTDKLMRSFDQQRTRDSFIDLTKPLLDSNIPDTIPAAPQVDKTAVRKGLEHRLVRDLPNCHLFTPPAPTDSPSMPFPLRWEHHRVAEALGEVIPRCCNTTELYEHLQNSNMKSFEKTPESVWKATKDYAQAHNVIYKANLAFNPGGSPEHLYNLTLQPLRQERASRLQRNFGSHRFLYLEMPQISRLTLPSHLKDQVSFLKDRFLEWMCTDKEFLGCKWRVFHIQDIKKKHTQDVKPGQRLVLFAVEGPGMQRISIGKLLDWAIPLSYNAHQGFCKAYARLDLFLSQTIPTVVFKPSEVKSVRDTRADGTAECTLFNDPRLKFESGYNPFNQAVMNDGCSLLSGGAAKEVCEIMGITGIRPVAFQGRINGCKGVWSISAPYDTTDPTHQAKWINITESQRKVYPRKEDEADELCEIDRWSFEVVKSTSPPKSSTLNLEFIPILKDRDVSRHTLREVVESQIQLDLSAFLDSLKDPIALRRWIHSQFSLMEEVNRMNPPRHLGSLPVESVERTITLIEAGFIPTECQYLAECITQISNFWLARMKQKLKIHLGRSTMALGIADPTGCLKPGEIHLAFSETFRDEASGEVWSYLRGEVLVARHPSLRNSDVQKVKAVYKEELSHLTDVVVFPSTGCIPLAHKLQGGDYDGDTFWLCWDRRLTSSFLNAPAPLDMRSLEYFGIQKDSRKLGEVLGKDQANVDNWLVESFKFKLQEDRLGQVTNFHKKLSYKENDISSPSVDALADLHDLVIDSAKNGYTFTYSAWSSCVREKLGIKQSLHKPAYERWMEPKPDSPLHDDDAVQPNHQHIIDFLLFEVVNPCIVRMQRTRKKRLECTGTIDTDLEKVFKNRQTSSNPVIKEVLQQLILDVDHVKFLCNPTMGREYFDVQARKTYESYVSIQPIHAGDPLIQEWLRREVGHDFTTWEIIKASAFYSKRHKKSTLMFICAGRELCHIKAMRSMNTRSIVDGVYATYKPRKEKRKGLGRHVGEVVEEDDTDEDDFS